MGAVRSRCKVGTSPYRRRSSPVKRKVTTKMSRSFGYRMGAAVAGACVTCATLAGAATADTPPAPGHKITVLPSRDTIVATGYTEGLTTVVSVLRFNAATKKFDVVSRSQPVLPQDDPATPGVFDGIVSVNRADGGCWRRLTPDIRAGDRVRVIQRDGTGAVVVNDSTITGSVNASAAKVVFD